MDFCMKEWRQGWIQEVRHWPTSRRRRLIEMASERNKKHNESLTPGTSVAPKE